MPFMSPQRRHSDIHPPNKPLGAICEPGNMQGAQNIEGGRKWQEPDIPGSREDFSIQPKS